MAGRAAGPPFVVPGTWANSDCNGRAAGTVRREAHCRGVVPRGTRTHPEGDTHERRVAAGVRDIGFSACVVSPCGPLCFACLRVQPARGDPFPARFPNLTGRFHLVHCVPTLDRFHVNVHNLKPFLCNATPRKNNMNCPLGCRGVLVCSGVIDELGWRGKLKVSMTGLRTQSYLQRRSLLIRVVWCRVALGRGPPWGWGPSVLVLGGRRGDAEFSEVVAGRFGPKG